MNWLVIKKEKAIIPFDERIMIIKSIKYVDKAVSQSNMDKMAAWRSLKFDAMFVGNDWKGTKRWNEYEKEFLEVGVETVYFDYTKNTSSTKLRGALDLLIKKVFNQISLKFTLQKFIYQLFLFLSK